MNPSKSYGRTDRQTDGRTDKTRNAAHQGRPHNKLLPLLLQWLVSVLSRCVLFLYVLLSQLRLPSALMIRSESSCRHSLSLSLSLSLIPGRGGGHRSNPFQVAPDASRIGCKAVSWPGVPPGVIVGRTLEHQMLDRLSALCVRTCATVTHWSLGQSHCQRW